MNLSLGSVFVNTSKGYLTCCKILLHGADGFTSPPKENVLRICVTLPRPGLNPRTLDPMANTLTARSPRSTMIILKWLLKIGYISGRF
jgi:hypothetical protein